MSVLAFALAAGGLPARALAAPDAPATATEDTKASAARAFAQGSKAYKSGSYRDAAHAFEIAYKLRPHPDVLWNAARAWQRAGEVVSAAKDYELYLRTAAVDAPDRAAATAALADLTSKVARFEVAAPDADAVLMDGEPIDLPTVYALPGAHLFEAHKGDRVARRGEKSEASSVTRILLDFSPAEPPVVQAPVPAPTPPAAPVAPETQPVAPVTAPPTQLPPRSSGISPAFAITGGVLTATGIVLTVLSGLSTTAYKNDVYDAAPTAANKDAGFALERRTNILLTTTVILGAATGIVAVYFTNWTTARGSVELGMGLGSCAVRGAF